MKKVLNYLLLLMIAMVAFNLQSCDKDDDDDATIEGTWKLSVMSYTENGSIITESISDSDTTMIAYWKIDGKYLYVGTFDEGTWDIYRTAYTIKDGKLYDSEGNYVNYTASSSKLTIVFPDGNTKSEFKKADTPADIEIMIANGEYDEAPALFENEDEDEYEEDDEDDE